MACGWELPLALVLAVLVVVAADGGGPHVREVSQPWPNNVPGKANRRTLLRKEGEKLGSDNDGDNDGNGRQTGPKIVGGTVAPCGRYPYMASLRDRTNEHKCGGVLIDPYWVVTAAHCVDPNSDGSLGLTPITVVGACNLGDDANDAGDVEMFIPEEAIVHKDFTGEVQQGADIALLKLATASKHTPISLPSGNATVGTSDPLVVLGWGRGPPDDKSGDLHQGTNIKVVPNDICSGENVWGDIINDGMMCAFAINFDGDTCDGDSGGPALRAFAPEGDVAEGSPELDVIFGVTSFGAKDAQCGGIFVPGVYTSVPYHVNWIDEKIKGSRKAASAPTPPADTAPVGPGAQDYVNGPQSAQGPQQTAPGFTPAKAPAEGETAKQTPKEKPTDVSDASAVEPALPVPAPDAAPQEVASPAEPRQDARSPGPHATDAPRTGRVHNAEILDLAAGKEKSTTTTALNNLLSDGGDADACCTHLGRSALHETTRHDNAAAAAALLAHGAAVDVLDDQGQTPLHLAAIRNARRVAEALIAGGADVNAADSDGETPLHDAAEWGRLKIANILLDGGAEQTVRDGEGRRPFEAICSNRCHQSSRRTKKLQQLLLVF